MDVRGSLENARERVGKEVDPGSSRDVVDDDRTLYCGRNRNKVLAQAVLRRLVVIGHDDHHGVGAGFFRRARELDRVFRRRRARSGDDEGLSLGLRNGARDEVALLVRVKGWALAGRLAMSAASIGIP